MSEQLILTWITHPEVPSGDARAAFLAAIRDASNTELADALCRSCQDEVVVGSLPESVSIDNGACSTAWVNSPEAMSAVETYFHEAVDTLYPGGALTGCATVIEAAGTRLIVAGGSTWGDDPFDGFGAVSALAELDPFANYHTAPL